MMKLIFSILLFSLQLIFAQGTYVAVITDPQIGPQINAMNLIGVVDDINKRQNIAQVVVLGNITANGKFDEFVWTQEILDGLTAPYFVVGGERDYFQSEGKGSEISLLWGDDKNIFNTKNFSAVCLNTFLPDFPPKKYIDVETVSWFEDKLSDPNISRLLTFSYHPIQISDNSDQFFEMNLNKKIFSFVAKNEKGLRDKSVFEGLYLNRKEGWGYLLVSTIKDSIHIKKILSEEIKKKVKPEIDKLNFTKTPVLESKKPVSFVQSRNMVWQVSFGQAINESIVYDEKIFTTFKSGTVNCLNKDGSELWLYETNKKFNTAPSIEDELLVNTSLDGDIITVNTSTGDPNQIIGIGENITTGVAVNEINVAGFKTKTSIVGTQYGNLYCHDLSTLDPVWTKQISGMDENLEITPAIVPSNNKIFFCDNNGSLYCLSAQTGMLIWNISSSKGGWKSLTNITVLNNNLYLIDRTGNLYCIDALLGEPKWSLKNIYANGLTAVNEKNELILPTKKNSIAVITTKVGKVISEIHLPAENDQSISDLTIISNNILVGNTDGWVYRINTKQKVEKFFRNSSAPIVSLEELDGQCLVSDYDGTVTLLKLSGK